jgi:hypothetical protein
MVVLVFTVHKRRGTTVTLSRLALLIGAPKLVFTLMCKPVLVVLSRRDSILLRMCSISLYDVISHYYQIILYFPLYEVIFNLEQI